MTSADAVKRAAKLRQTIADLRFRYHVTNDPTATDTVYSSLMDELRKLEEKFPAARDPNSPTRRVAGKPLAQFKKIKHATQQWSFDDAFTADDVRAFDERVKKLLGKERAEYICELKIDGLHLVLTYEKGKLITAATRGDGAVGEEVTENIKTIHSLPLVLPEPISAVIEGEVWMSTRIFEALNKERVTKGEAEFANPRNAAAGAIRQLDPKIAAARHLEAFLYDISLVKDGFTKPNTQAAELKLLARWGFQVNKDWQLCKNIDEVISFWKKWQKKKTNETFWVDGVVVKLNSAAGQSALGYTGKAPRWGIAFKFPAEEVATVVENVAWQVGRTKVITPVAHLRPVAVAGTTVTHATLHNLDEIKRLNLKIGDTVVLLKAGDVIPKIKSVIITLRDGTEKSIVPPKKCPVCEYPVERLVDEVAIYCTNKNCPASNKENLAHFVGRGAAEIDGLGEKIIAQLMDEGLVATAADIFYLTFEDLIGLDRFAEISAHKLIAAIQAGKKIPLAQFIFALGIRHVGEETAVAIARHTKNLENFLALTDEEAQKIAGIGEVVTKSAVAWVTAAVNQKQIQRMLAAGVKILPWHEQAGPLTGRVFLFTGTLEKFSREEASAKARALGAAVADDLTSKVTDLVVGVNPGSKLAKAKKLGTRQLTESEFLRIIGV